MDESERRHYAAIAIAVAARVSVRDGKMRIHCDVVRRRYVLYRSASVYAGAMPMRATDTNM